MRHVIRLLVLVVATLGLLYLVAGTVKTGGASGIGTASTLGGALQSRIAAATPGDVLLLEPGDYGKLDIREIRDLTLRSADPAHPAVFAALAVGLVDGLVLDGILFDYTFTDADIDASVKGLNWPFKIQKSSNVTIRNSVFDGDILTAGRPAEVGFPAASGLVVRFVNGFTLENCEVFGFQRGLGIDNSSKVVIRGNNIHGLRMDGMNLAALSTALIEGNHVHDFNRNLATGDHADMIQFWTAGTKVPSTNITIRGNLLDSGAGLYTQSIFMRNEVFDQGKAGPEMLYRNLLIEQNVILNAHLHGITVGEGDGIVIRNNTLIHNPVSNGPENNPGLWIPSIILARRSVNVTVTANISAEIILKDLINKWDVSGNLTAQDRNPTASGWYDKIFVNAINGVAADLSNYAYRPDGPAGGGNIGAAALRPDRVAAFAASFPPTTRSGAQKISAVVAPAKAVQITAAVAATPPPEAQTPQAKFTAQADAQFVNRFSLDASASVLAGQGEGAEYVWDLAGVPATGPVVSHDFPAAGKFLVRLTIKLPSGSAIAAEATVLVPEPGILRFDPKTGQVLANSAQGFGPLAGIPAVTLPEGGMAIEVGQAAIALPPSATAGFFAASGFDLALRFRTAKGARASGDLMRIDQALYLTITANGSLEAQIPTTGGGKGAVLRTGPLKLHDAQWHDVSLRFDGSTADLYIDGTRQATAPLHGSTMAMKTSGISFGDGAGRKSFSGQIGALELNSNVARFAR